MIKKEWRDFNFPYSRLSTDNTVITEIHVDSANDLDAKEASVLRKRVGYRSKIIDTARVRLSTRFVLNPKFIAFEKTPAYVDQANPIDIASVVPGAKIMVILRNPMERLHSAYWHICHMDELKNCNAQQFRSWVATAFKAAQVDKRKVDINAVRGISNGLYVEYMQTWFDAFPQPGRFLIMFSDEFQRDPFETLRGIEKYFGLRHYNFKKIAKQRHGMWALSSYSKVYSEASKPPGYSKLADDKEMSQTLNALYSGSIRRLREFLLQKNKTSSTPIFIQRLPKWILEA